MSIINTAGVCVGIVGIYTLCSGAVVAYQKVNPDSSDIMLMGLSLMFVAQFLIGMAKPRGQNSTVEPPVSGPS